MHIVRAVASMQRLARRWQRDSVKVGFVPTMGYLHDGHLSLVQRARRLVGPRGKVVVSIYVNPTQFGPKEDFKSYPRDLKTDAARCRAQGVDIIFAPSDREMYPNSSADAFSTYVVEETLSRTMEGKSRPGHFRGVTTVLAKLFNIVQPTVAVFGAKDYQQAAVVRRMVRDLNFPLKIVTAPIFREPDGLAMSSRNKYLQGNLRFQARVLWQAIQKTRQMLKQSRQPIAASKLKKQLRQLIEKEPTARLDYVEFFEPKTLLPVAKVWDGAHMALAVFIGKTRLIDNAAL